MADTAPALDIPTMIRMVQAKITNAPDAPLAEKFMARDIRTAAAANLVGTEKDKREAAAALRVWL
jgi:hypothetical protein